MPFSEGALEFTLKIIPGKMQNLPQNANKNNFKEKIGFNFIAFGKNATTFKQNQALHTADVY